MLTFKEFITEAPGPLGPVPSALKEPKSTTDQHPEWQVPNTGYQSNPKISAESGRKKKGKK